MKYNDGNYNKYTTKNPLKRKMVNRLNKKILEIVAASALNFHMQGNTRTERRQRLYRILDAGCGEGFISDMLYDEINNIEIVGLEFTEEAIQIAQKMNSNVTFKQGDIMNMPFESHSFDFVLCTEVLEHLEDPAGALNELMRVAKDVILITVPHEPWFRMGNMLVLKNLTRFGNPIDHISHWTYKGFYSFLKKNSIFTWKLKKSFPWTIAKCDVGNEKEYMEENYRE